MHSSTYTNMHINQEAGNSTMVTLLKMGYYIIGYTVKNGYYIIANPGVLHNTGY